MADLKAAEGGRCVTDLCREHGMSSATFLQAEGLARFNDYNRGNRRITVVIPGVELSKAISPPIVSSINFAE